MRCFKLFAVAWLIVAMGILTAAGQEEKPEELSSKEQFKAQLQALLPGMGAEKIPDRRDSQQKFQEACFQLGTPGREPQRVEACRVIAETLGTELAKPARIWLLKQLAYLGREECVDAVAKSLDDGDAHVRDAARRALANNPAPQATAKFLAKLGNSNGAWRVALISALGSRGDEAAVGALAGLLGNSDHAAATAAANALGRIGGSKAAGALKAALPKAPDALGVTFADAYLRCADKLLKDGKAKEAAAIYNELSTDDHPRLIRLAALKGKLEAAGRGGK